MTPVGYARLIEMLGLHVMPFERPAAVTGAVNQRVDSASKVLFPRGVAVEDTVVGHLEFALRHEGVNLEIIDAVFELLDPERLQERLKKTPTGAQIRRACALWEWLTGRELSPDRPSSGGYVDLFPSDKYVVAEAPVNLPKFRVRDNALGTSDFCPTVHLSGLPASPSVVELLARADSEFAALTEPDLYDRALSYLYLSETRSSFAIERESLSSSKEERFVQLLGEVGQAGAVNEERLVELQNIVARTAFDVEFSYRTRQNWLSDATGRVTFFPPAPEDLRRAMTGLEAFLNHPRSNDPLINAAVAGFGFVYLHPFMDGNGRLHRFLIQHALARATRRGNAVKTVLVPVSAVMLKNIPAYLTVLSGFSSPVSRLWSYVRGDNAPLVTRAANSRSYRFINFDREVKFLHAAIKDAVNEEIPNELLWLVAYDAAFETINDQFELPRSDISKLIRMITSNGGTLSEHRRKQFARVPGEALDRIEAIIKDAFEVERAKRAAPARSDSNRS